MRGVVVLVVVGVVASTLGREPLARAQATRYQPVRVDLGVFAPYGHGIDAYGFGATIEPKFNATDHLTVGLRFEGAVLMNEYGVGGPGGGTINEAATAAFLAKAEYFLTESVVRPFFGFATGLYYLGAQTVGPAGIHQEAGRYFGIGPQVGMDLGAVRLAVTYDILLGASAEVQQTIGNPQTASLSRNYLAFELAFRIGGARLEAPPASPAGPPPRP
jgi:hypothetical protein